jgi:ribonucleases P/MRP protein subunit RPP40
MIEECRGMKYNERLAVSGLTSLEDRRNRGDLIEVFKMIKGFSKVDYRIFFTLDENSRTRGHRYKLVKSRSRLEIRKNFFSQRVVNQWNQLPSTVVEADTVNAFKNRYDRHVRKLRK